MKKFLMKCFDCFWNNFNSGWWIHFRTFVMALTLFYITEILFLENNKMIYLMCLVFHSTINFILLPWLYGDINNESDNEINYEAKKTISGISYYQRKLRDDNEN